MNDLGEYSKALIAEIDKKIVEEVAFFARDSSVPGEFQRGKFLAMLETKDIIRSQLRKIYGEAK